MFFLGDMAVCLMGNLWFKATVCGVRCTFQWVKSLGNGQVERQVSEVHPARDSVELT